MLWVRSLEQRCNGPMPYRSVGPGRQCAHTPRYSVSDSRHPSYNNSSTALALRFASIRWLTTETPDATAPVLPQ
jgi:hypothetical protein